MALYQWEIVLTSVKVVAWFAVIYLLVAGQIFTLPRKMAGRWWNLVTRMTFVVVVLIQALVMVGAYDFISLVVSLLVIYLVLLFTRPEGMPRTALEKISGRVVLFALDAMERRVNYRRTYEDIKERFLNWAREKMPGRDSLIWGIFTAWVFVMAAILRLYGILMQAGASEYYYVHLSRIKGLSSNTLFVDGVYPYGAYAFISSIGKFAMKDEAFLLRVSEALMGVLVAYVIYSVVVRFSGRRAAGLFAAFMYAVLPFAGYLPGFPIKSSETLIAEFGLAFFLATLMLLADYMLDKKEKGSYSLFAFFCGMAVLWLGQPLMGLVALFIVVVAGLPMAIIMPGKRILSPVYLALVTALSALPAAFFYGIALLGGQGFPYFAPNIQTLLGKAAEAGPQTENFYVMLFMAIGLPILTLIPSGRGKEEDTRMRGGAILFGVSLLVTGKLWWGSTMFGHPPDFSNRMVGMMMSVLYCVMVGFLWGQIEAWFISVFHRIRKGELRYGLASNVVVALAMIWLFLLVTPSFTLNIPPKAEYDVFVENLNAIKREFLSYTWTIVGRPEQLPGVIGRGWFLSSDYFLENYNPETYANDPKNPKLGVPTDHVFILVEKEVLANSYTGHLRVSLSERDAQQQELRSWCDTYMRLHDDMNIYYEDKDVIIYHLNQPIREGDSGQPSRIEM